MAETWVDADGCPLFVRSAGSQGADHTVICLHGFPESGATWAPLLPTLTARRHVLMPDGRGFGRSGCPTERSAYGINRLVADVLLIADAFGADRFTLIGHDWGGVVAWCTAAAHPDRVSHLVAINAPHPTLFQAALDKDAEQRAASTYIAALTAPGAADRLTPERLWDMVFASDETRGLIGPAEKADLLAAWSRPGATAAMLNWYREAPFDFSAVGGQGAGRLPRALKIDVPTLVVWAMQDTILRPTLVEGLGELVPDLTIDAVEGAGHGIVREQPERVAQAITTYLETRSR